MHSRTATAACTFLLSFIAYNVQAEYNPTPTNTGVIGLNTVPNARHDKKNTIRTGLSNLDPFLHAYIGLQLTNQLHINIRQTAEISNINKDAKALYPGTDIKWRMSKENNFLPEVSIGAQSAFGHKRMAGEYIALSKRYKNFDITAGIGWGRFATAQHLKNPLTAISKHFEKDRNLNDEHPNTPEHWFTGQHIGFFGGLQYDTPIKNLSLKADYGADRYSAEKSAFNYNAPSPWSLGLSYSPKEWVNIGVAMQGTDKIMSRLSLQSSPDQWPVKSQYYDPPLPAYKNRAGTNAPNIEQIINTAKNNGITLSNIHYTKNTFFAELQIEEHTNTPKHLGRAIRIISANAGTKIEEIVLTPISGNLRAATIRILRSDVEKALNKTNGSPEEIWKSTAFSVTQSEQTIHNTKKKIMGIKPTLTYKAGLENTLSLSEEDSGHLYRSSIIGQANTSPFLGFFTSASLRLNISDNLERLDKIRRAQQYNTRGDINAYTQQRLSLEHAYIGYSKSLTPSLHSALTAGYTEEQYASLSGQLLYRPFASRFALGAEIHHAFKRIPTGPMNLQLYEGATTSGHINIWYDMPQKDITLRASFGRFLATDIGIDLGLEKHFKNGAKLSTSIALSNYAEPDIFGGTTHASHNITLTLPIGEFKHIPNGSYIKTQIKPVGRNIAQRLEKPYNLYEQTQNLTLKHIGENWHDILN